MFFIYCTVLKCVKNYNHFVFWGTCIRVLLGIGVGPIFADVCYLESVWDPFLQ